MHRTLTLLGLLVIGCGSLPFSWALGDAKRAEPKVVAAPPPPPGSTLGVGPPPPPTRAPAALPAGHLDRASFHALTGGAVVQAQDPRGLFDRSRSVEAPRVRGGLLVCRVEVTGHGYDDGFFAGGADVYMTLRVGRGAPRRAPHRSVRVFTFPVEDLREGDTLSLTVMDDDVFSDDLIGRGASAYAGGETRVDAAPGANVVCRPVDPAVVERSRERALRDVRRAIARLGEARPDPLAYDFGYPTDRAPRVVAATRDALALMTITDDALAAEIDRAVDFEDTWQQAVQDALDEELARRPAPGAHVEVSRLGTMRVERFSCGADAADLRASVDVPLSGGSGCVALIEVTPRRQHELTPAPGALESWALSPDGSMRTATLVAVAGPSGTFRAEPTTLARREPTTLLWSFPPGARPTLLRVRDGGGAALVRLQ